MKQDLGQCKEGGRKRKEKKREKFSCFFRFCVNEARSPELRTFGALSGLRVAKGNFDEIEEKVSEFVVARQLLWPLLQGINFCHSHLFAQVFERFLPCSFVRKLGTPFAVGGIDLLVSPLF